VAQEPVLYVTKIVDNQTGKEIIPWRILTEISLRVTDVNSGSYTLQSTDNILHVTYTSTGSVSIILPTSELTRTGILVIKDGGLSANTNNITISTEGTEKIDGEDTAIISSDGTSLNFYTDGSNWFIY
jgi:hypothetical protein